MASIAEDNHLFAALHQTIAGHTDSICFCAIEHVMLCWSVLYHDTKTGKDFIEVTSGAKKIQTALHKPTGFIEEYNWRGIVAFKQAGQLFLCAIAEERATNRIAVINFQVKIADCVLLVIDQKLIDFDTIAADCELLTIQRNSKSCIDCILVSSKLTSSPQYHHIQLSLHSNGQISHKFEAKNLKSTSDWSNPFIIDDHIYLMHKSKRKLRCLLMQVDIELNGLGHGFEKIGQASAIFKDCAIYYLLDEDVGQLWLLDVKEGRWQKGQSFFDNVLTQESAIVDVLSSGKLYVHGNCAQNNSTDKAYIYCMELIPPQIINQSQQIRWDDMKKKHAPVELKTVVARPKGQQQPQNPLPHFAQLQMQEEPKMEVENELQLIGPPKAQQIKAEPKPEENEKNAPKWAPGQARAFGPRFVPQQESIPIIPQTQRKIPKKLPKVWPPPQPDASQVAEQPLLKAKQHDSSKYQQEYKQAPVREKPLELKATPQDYPEKEKEKPEIKEMPFKGQPPIPKQRQLYKQQEEQKQTPIPQIPVQEIAAKRASVEKEELPKNPTLTENFTLMDNPAPLSQQNKISEANKWMPKGRRELEKIGEGAFGVVWKCCDDELRLFVAKQTKIFDEESMQIAENEVEHLKALTHKHIIEYYGCVRENHVIIIYMEFMPFGSMRRFLDSAGALEESTAVIYIRQILDGLAYIHSKLILHSDLKCDNLLLDGHGKVKIGDFGIAVQMYLNNDKSSFMMTDRAGGGGTLYWMAPEVITNEYISKDETYGRAADMWSLGCTIVEMLTVYPPYFLKYQKEMEFLGALGANMLSYNPNEMAPNASVEMSMFLFGLFVIDKTKRIRVGADAQAKFQVLFPE